MAYVKESSERVKIGLVVNEFFCDEYPPLGGFGLSAKNFAEFFNSRPEFNIDVLALLPQYKGTGPAPTKLHGTKIIEIPDGFRKTRARLVSENIDVLLSIDYYPDYLKRLAALPRTPWIHWARDPRSAENWDRILSLINSGYPCEYSEAAKYRNRNYLHMQILSRILNRKVCFAVQEAWLADRLKDGYPLAGNSIYRLVNRIPVPKNISEKTGRPAVLFIGRLLPIKRPWIFFEVAQRLPDYEFFVVGEMDTRQHLKEIVNNAESIPNLKFLGKRTGSDLHEIFNRSWLLLNTSVHEGMPQSVLEALAFGIPVVSSLDFGGMVNRFGISVGATRGSGHENINVFCEVLTNLIKNDQTRKDMGEAGRKFVQQYYSDQAFLNQFALILADLGYSVEGV